MRRMVAVITATVLALGVVGLAMAGGNGSSRGAFTAGLTGFQEVPAISSTGTGSLKLSLNSAGTELSYTLTFSGLQGGPAGAAHIHLGQAGANGGVMAFLCGGGEAACPAGGGTVTGTIIASEIQAIAAQGLAAGDFAAALKAMRSGVTYVNVHNASFPTGEIRGQIKGNRAGKHD